MHDLSYKKLALNKKIALLPDDKINKIMAFIDDILKSTDSNSLKRVNLCGIWKNKGFEKIENLESEIKKVRKQLNNSTLKIFF